MKIQTVKLLLLAGFFINGIAALLEVFAEYLGKPETYEDDIYYLLTVLCIGFYGIIKAIEKKNL